MSTLYVSKFLTSCNNIFIDAIYERNNRACLTSPKDNPACITATSWLRSTQMCNKAGSTRSETTSRGRAAKRLVSKAYETQTYRREIAFHETSPERKHLRAEISRHGTLSEPILRPTPAIGVANRDGSCLPPLLNSSSSSFLFPLFLHFVEA